MFNIRLILTMTLLTVLVAAPDYGEAASIINIAPAGAAAYSITATDLQESAGIDLTVFYDAAALESPKVKSGVLTASAFMQENVATSGIVRIVFITGGAIKGTGELASVTFTSKGKASAQQPKLSSSVYAVTGSQLAVQSTSGTPQTPPENIKVDDTVKNSAASSSSAAGGSAGYVYPASGQSTQQTGATLGSVSISQEPATQNDLFREDVRKEERREETAFQNVPADSGVVAVGGTAAPRETAATVVTETKTVSMRSTLKSSQSVLDRFSAYKDIRTLKRLSTLFDQSALQAAGIVQSPAIVVTDGKSIMTVAVNLPDEFDSPSFSLKGANQKSIRRVSDNKWELDLLPQKGKSDVRLSILLKGERTEIALVAVAPIDRRGTELTALSAADLDTLLARPLKNKKPAYDLNSDGRQNYLDDYILVAHWLLKQQHSSNGVVGKPAADGK